MFAETRTAYDLKFRFLGFPCVIGVFFWLGALMLSGINFNGPESIKLFLIWVATLLISVLIHELGHAIAARRFGCKVTEVKLQFLGGYCSYNREPEQRWQRITICLAGPIAGFLLWGVLKGLLMSEFFANIIVANVYLMLFVEFLLIINLIMSIFNLLPIYPMDGGRVCAELLEGWNVPDSFVLTRWIGFILATVITVYCLLFATGTLPESLRTLFPWWLRPSMQLALFMALMAFTNYQALQIARSREPWQGYD